MKKRILFVIIWGLLAAYGGIVAGANVIPVRTDVAGFPDWQDVNVAGTSYLQLVVGGASTTTPTMNFTAYSSIRLDFKARTYGGVNVDENTITVAVSVDNGLNWEVIGTRVPLSSTLTVMESFNLSLYSGLFVKVRLSVAGQSNSIGVGIDDISITEQSVWIEDFESGVKTTYAEADVTVATGSWKLTEAVMSNSVDDKKNGAKSVRLRSGGVVAMNFDKTDGAGTVTVYHANYGLLTGASWKLQASYNGGDSWHDQGDVVECGSVLTPAIFELNYPGVIRFRVVHLSGDRMNIDDFTIGKCNNIPVSTSWTGVVSREWYRAANWSNGVPGTVSSVIIGEVPDFPEIDIPVSIASIDVLPTAQLSIHPSGSLNVTGNMTLQSSVRGTASLVNNGSLTVKGRSRVEQYLSAGNGPDGWWYISSPVNGALSGCILTSASGNKLGYYDEASVDYPQIQSGGQELVAGKGYLASIATTGVYCFDGSYNSGPVVSPPLSRTGAAGAKRGFNLVGNPYPSYLDWNAVTGFGTSQMRTDIRPTIWIRTRNASGAMVFDTFDGEDGTSLGIRGRVNNFIAPLQAFWVKVNEDGALPTLEFNNSMRLHQDQSDASNLLKAPTNRQIVCLELLTSDSRDETILSTNASATDGFDVYDSEKMSTGEPEIFSVVDGKELVINKMQRLEPGKQLQLGFRPLQSGRFELKVSRVVNQGPMEIVLKDLHLSTESRLKEGDSYYFDHDITSGSDRFQLEFRATDAISALDKTQADQPKIYRNSNGQLVIEASESLLGSTLQVWTVDGRLLHRQTISEPVALVDIPVHTKLCIVQLNSNFLKISISNFNLKL
jgi:hypothetical protein